MYAYDHDYVTGQEFEKCLVRLIDDTPKERLAAALELQSLGIRHRGNVLPRGSWEEAASALLPTKVQNDLQRILEVSRGEFRQQLLAGIAQWSDDRLCETVSKIIIEHADDQTVDFCIRALETIGGPRAVELLKQLTGHESEDIREFAQHALNRLKRPRSSDLAEPSMVSEPIAAHIPPRLQIDTVADPDEPTAKTYKPSPATVLLHDAVISEFEEKVASVFAGLDLLPHDVSVRKVLQQLDDKRPPEANSPLN